MAGKAADPKASQTQQNDGPAQDPPQGDAPEVKPPAEKDAPKDPKAKEKSEQRLKMEKRATQVFASHKVDKLYFTEDCTAFLEPQFARIHAESLKSDQITIIERKEIE